LDDKNAAPPEIGVLTVTIRHDAGFQLKNKDSSSFASEARYTFSADGAQYGLQGSFGTKSIGLLAIVAVSADPPPVILEFLHSALSCPRVYITNHASKHPNHC
jgi:hypothetical protein